MAFHAMSKFMSSCFAYSDVLWLDFMSSIPLAEKSVLMCQVGAKEVVKGWAVRKTLGQEGRDDGVSF